MSGRHATTPAGEDLDPRPHPDAVVQRGPLRVTVLTSRLLRIEHAPGGAFDDRPTLFAVRRRLPVPTFEVSDDDGWLVIETEHVRARLRPGPLAAETAEVRFRFGDGWRTWRPGMDASGNLGGTVRTLDRADGAVPLDDGVLSRDGWAVVDDAARPRLEPSASGPWPAAAPEAPGYQDLYLFAHGRDYRAALADFAAVSGPIPMPPRYAFGAWWSRNWAYTDREILALADDFDAYGVPLDVVVVDMDWHETFGLRWDDKPRDHAGQPMGWSGHTWNRAFFPDPERFLAELHGRGLKTALNLHPASGVPPHEKRYPEAARAVGIDPTSGAPVPFDVTSRAFMDAYLGVVLRPIEEQGADFWWLDWQQGEGTALPGLTNTFWLNHVFYRDMEAGHAQGRRGRPLVFHRWGGLGGHRYPIGFSGDTVSTWDSLAFQPRFTATASNVGFGYWSHDIGGHVPGDVSPELFTRWVQWGALSPVLRTHAVKNVRAERRLWAYPPEPFAAMRRAYRLRYRLAPALYTAARRAYDTGVSPLRPLYYDWPWLDDAYADRAEYLVGDGLLAAPVVRPMAEAGVGGLSLREVWLPPGRWTEWDTGAVLDGPAVLRRTCALDETPLYLRADAAVPLAPPGTRRLGGWDPAPLEFALSPVAARGEGAVFEDDGDSDAYREGAGRWTRLVWERPDARTLRVSITPDGGTYVGAPDVRRYTLRLRGSWPLASVAVDGEPLADAARYDGQALEAAVSFEAGADAAVSVTLGLEGDAESPLLWGVPGALRRLQLAMETANTLWRADWSPDSLHQAVQTGRRVELDPASSRSELEGLRAALPTVEADVAGLRGDRTTLRRAVEDLQAAMQLVGVEPSVDPDSITPDPGSDPEDDAPASPARLVPDGDGPFVPLT